MIDFNQIYKMATDLISYLASSRGYIEPNTTVCVILAKSGRVFNGVSHNEVHAEVEVVRNMQSFNESTVESLILVDAGSRLAMLPCPNCIRFITSLNPANAAAMVNMPDRPVPFREILPPSQPIAANQPLPQGMPVSVSPVSGYMPVQQQVAVSATRSSMVMTGRSKAALLSGKVNGLLAAAQNEEQSDEDLELLDELKENAQKKKGLLGGLFGKKK